VLSLGKEAPSTYLATTEPQQVVVIQCFLFSANNIFA